MCSNFDSKYILNSKIQYPNKSYFHSESCHLAIDAKKGLITLCRNSSLKRYTCLNKCHFYGKKKFTQ